MAPRNCIHGHTGLTSKNKNLACKILANLAGTIFNFIKFKIMKKFNLSVKQCKMIEKSIRYTISDLQRNNFLQTQHHLSGHACGDEIRQLKELQKIFF